MMYLLVIGAVAARSSTLNYLYLIKNPLFGDLAYLMKKNAIGVAKQGLMPVADQYNKL